MPGQPITTPAPEYDPANMGKIVHDIERRLDMVNQPAAIGYSVSNYTPSRTLDASIATTEDIANFLCTLVDDLKAVGRLA